MTGPAETGGIAPRQAAPATTVLLDGDRALRMRLVFDGRRFIALVDDEPVLYRALQDVHPSTRSLLIAEIAMVSAWERGHDTGSALHRFVARGRPPAADVAIVGGNSTTAVPR